MVMNPTRKCHLQYSVRPRRGAGTDSCLSEPIFQRWVSPTKYHLVSLQTFSPTHDRGAELAVSVRVAAIGALRGRPRVVEDKERSHRLGVVILWVREKKATTECDTERKKPITNAQQHFGRNRQTSEERFSFSIFQSQFFGVFFVCFCLSHFLSRVEALWTSLRSSADILLGSWAMLPVMMVTMTTRARPLVIMARDVLPPGGALVKCLLWPVIKRTHG